MLNNGAQNKPVRGEVVGKKLPLRNSSDPIHRLDKEFVKKLVEMRDVFFAKRYKERQIYEAEEMQKKGGLTLAERMRIDTILKRKINVEVIDTNKHLPTSVETQENLG